MRRYWFACVPLLLFSVQPPVFAKKPKSDSAETTNCQPKKKKHGMFGAIAGGIAGGALGMAGVPTGIGMLALPVGSLLTDAILKKLDCKEQVKAATATDTAVRGGVGTTSTWQSDTRPGVKGSSTVRDQRAFADGGSCMLITDVVIVDGEETTVDKRMCRKPGGGNYVLAA
jgi:predicted lipid-binding transport protein (Tim44 family)